MRQDFRLFTFFLTHLGCNFRYSNRVLASIRQLMLTEGGMTQEMFDEEIVNLKQSSGAFSINLAATMGYKLGKLRGSIFAILGTIIPSFFIGLICALGFLSFEKEILSSNFFEGMKISILAIIFIQSYRLIKKSGFSISTFILSILTLGAIVFLNVYPLLLIVGILLITIVYLILIQPYL